jgi:hypothetical protein
MTEEQEWIELEEGFEQLCAELCANTGCGKVGKPHPKSYRPDIPLSQYGLSDKRRAGLFCRLAATDKKQRAPAPKLYRANSPHPASYRPDLPLGCYSYAQLVKPTKQDRVAWAARPLTIIPSAYAACAVCVGTGRIAGKQCRDCEGEGIRRTIATTFEAIAAIVATEPKPLRFKREPVPHVVRVIVENTNTDTLPRSTRDTLRRAYIAWLKGRARRSENGQDYVIGKDRRAAWSDVVQQIYPTHHDFQQAAEAWQSPRNQRTLATH